MAVTPDIVDLARRASAGETAAADELLRELEPLVVRTIRLVVGSGSWTAEDAAQDALLDIDRGIHSLRDPRAVKAWALRVATQSVVQVGLHRAERAAENPGRLILAQTHVKAQHGCRP